MGTILTVNHQVVDGSTRPVYGISHDESSYNPGHPMNGHGDPTRFTVDCDRCGKPFAAKHVHHRLCWACLQGGRDAVIIRLHEADQAAKQATR
jgi:hypothetical protein